MKYIKIKYNQIKQNYHIKFQQDKQTEGKDPSKKAQESDQLIIILSGLITILNWKIKYIHRGSGADPWRLRIFLYFLVGSYEL